uniref:Ribosomal protein S13 n=1 Tax=Monomastix sp. (strain OKE-1) TaxID=141716 RepID=U5YGK9_MONSK|nr:ribosomal protein S13 [Monomastix sp. OKE-1]AGZ90211.1 ribosomal protein S13 [Monomastix sp. OKE-1]
MVYILNKNLPNKKKLRYALQEIFGIGPFVAQQISDQLGLSSHTLMEELTQSQIDTLVRIINNNSITGSDLKRVVQQDIKRLSTIGSYRGIRHTQHLPVRGQRTH